MPYISARLILGLFPITIDKGTTWLGHVLFPVLHEKDKGDEWIDIGRNSA